jgi:hypothetical protein
VPEILNPTAASGRSLLTIMPVFRIRGFRSGSDFAGRRDTDEHQRHHRPEQANGAAAAGDP